MSHPTVERLAPVAVPPSDPADEVIARVDEILCCLESAAASWSPAHLFLNPRRWHRVRYDKPLLVAPLDDTQDVIDTQQAMDPDAKIGAFWPQWRRAAGRDLSPGGLSFSHALPLPCRQAAVLLPDWNVATHCIVVKLHWCRFTRSGLYQSGGAFLRLLPLAEEPADNWSRFPEA